MRLVSINTAKSDPPYWKRLQLLGSGLGALDADVILLQEAFVGGAADTARALGNELGMRVEYTSARRKMRPLEAELVESESGMAVLSRIPMVGVQAVPLPSDPRDGERVAQLIVLAAQVVIGNVHLTHLRGAAALRQQQLDVMLRLIEADNHQQCLLGGDFNAELADFRFKRWDVLDLYRAGGGAMPCATVGERCIDHVLSLSGAGAHHARASGARLVLAESVDGVFPSDHRGVSVDIA
jgi:endonuclease/exonuclease/phosphatase family metal-dependent hydrolase